MAVYVDDLMASPMSPQWPYPESCHMFADTIDELHRFASMIGLRRVWFQMGKGRPLPHYDLTASRRRLAVQNGAIELDWDQAVDKWEQIAPRKTIPAPGRKATRSEARTVVHKQFAPALAALAKKATRSKTP